MKILTQLEPAMVFNYFEEISQIPRGSGNEKAISDYLVNFAKKMNLDVIQDEALNVIIKKPGTEGYENSPAVIIQGHMDMVCEKNKGTEHDFEKDPLKLRIIDDFVYATDTTLGADNGIAVAYAMALLSSNDIPHPPLEVLITVDEETGMSGAMAVDGKNFNGKYLINIDNEEEGQLLVSCAGGVKSTVKIPVEFEERDSNKLLATIKIRGLKGGHSGIEIHKERGNANKILGRVLMNLLEEINYKLSSINGGSKDNAIPREGDAVIEIKEEDKDILINEISKWQSILLNELHGQDPDIKLTVDFEEVSNAKILTDKSTLDIVRFIYLMPNGINTRSVLIDGLVESSTNLGVVITGDNSIEFHSAVRSSVATLKEEIVLRTKALAELFNGSVELKGAYPEWQYDEKSELREVCQKVYEEMYGKKAEVVAIHAGVECGLLKQKIGDIDMISFGPNLYDVHTPEEHMSISSVKRSWEYLKAILKELK